MEIKDYSAGDRYVAVLTGSVRPGNYTSKAADVVVDHLDSRNLRAELFDPTGKDLPLPGAGGPTADTERLRLLVNGATGVVFVTPEYHGSFSSITKLMIENMGYPSVLATKPVALVGVAAGVIGAIKSLEALRGVCSHVGAIVLPGPVSVARVKDAFNESGKVIDPKVEKMLRGAADRLVDYIEQNVCPRYALEAMVREQAA